MKDKLVTVFGAGGFIGRYVTRALLKAGARVRIAERDPRKAWFLKTQGGVGQTQFVAADLARSDTVERAIAGADAVVNLVGTFTGNLQRVHVDGARAVAEAAAKHGAGALVHVSAIGADPESPARYARTKGEGEAAVRAAFPGATIVRPATVFGPEDQFVNRFAAMIVAAPIVPILRAGVRFQPVFAGDVGDAIATAIASPDRFGGKAFALGGPDVFTMLELHRWIAQEIGRRPSFVSLPDAAGALIAALPLTPISRDQWLMLQHDTVVAPDANGLAALGVRPTPLDAVASNWLVRYRRNGRFATVAAD